MQGQISIDRPAVDLNLECETSSQQGLIDLWLTSHGGATVMNPCNAVPVVWSHDYTLGDENTGCGATGSVSVIFTAKDNCNETVTTTATIVITDTTSPTIVIEASDKLVQCDGTGNVAELSQWLDDQAGALVTDLCSGVTWTNDFTTLDSTGEAEVTFTATDECGNFSTTVATFRKRNSSTPIITDPAVNLNLECDEDLQQSQIDSWLANNGGAIISDTCNTAPVEWTHDYVPGDENTGCGATGSILVTFTANDNCGLPVTTTASITINDTTSPTITLPATDDIVKCDGNGNVSDLNNWLVNQGGATASDECSGVTWTNNFTELSYSDDSTASATVVFTATDECGNFITTLATFTKQNQAEGNVLKPAEDLNLECDEETMQATIDAWLAIYGGAESSDTCGTTPVVWVHDYSPGAENTGCGNTGSVLVTFTAFDNCGLPLTTTATITITDTTSPTISEVASDAYVECDGTGNVLELQNWLQSQGGAEAKDKCSSVVWTNNYMTLSDDCGGSGSTAVVFTATDECGNTSTSAASFNIEDTTQPSIDVPSVYLSLDCNSTFWQLEIDSWLARNGGAIGSDICSNESLVWTHDYVAGDESNETGSTLVTFTAIDNCGLFVTTSAEIVRTSAEATVLGPTTFCKGAFTTLEAMEGYSYLWSTGETTQSITVFSQGKYSLIVTDDNGCTSEGSVVVFEEDELIVSLTQPEPCIANPTLDAGNFATYQWSDGSTERTIKIEELGTYSVTVSDSNGCIGRTEIEIKDLGFSFDIIGNPIICHASESSLEVEDKYEMYFWSTGEETPIISVDQPGNYSVTVTDQRGCTSENTIELIQTSGLLPVLTGDDLCEGSTSILNAGSFDSYEWSDGSTGEILEVSEAGTYSVTVTDSYGCTSISEAIITTIVLEDPYGTDVSYCSGQELPTLVANHEAEELLRWYDVQGNVLQEGGSEFSPSTFGNYFVRAETSNAMCTSELVELALVEIPAPDIYMPNVISTNSSDDNLFYVQAGLKVERVEHFFIMDRWGNKMFDQRDFLPNDVSISWDGNYKGQKAKSGVYVWSVEYFACGKRIKKFGDVTILN